MTCITRPRIELSEPDTRWIEDVLEPDQLTSAKQHIGRQALSSKTLFLLWGLRVYVLFMVVMIAIEVCNAVHPAG